jgi:hypothetical protein
MLVRPDHVIEPESSIARVFLGKVLVEAKNSGSQF